MGHSLPCHKLAAALARESLALARKIERGKHLSDRAAKMMERLAPQTVQIAERPESRKIRSAKDATPTGSPTMVEQVTMPPNLFDIIRALDALSEAIAWARDEASGPSNDGDDHE